MRNPLFCVFADGVESYGDETASAKHCSREYETDARYAPQLAEATLVLGDVFGEQPEGPAPEPEPEPRLGPRNYGFSTGEVAGDSHTLQVRPVSGLPTNCRMNPPRKLNTRTPRIAAIWLTRAPTARACADRLSLGPVGGA